MGGGIVFQSTEGAARGGHHTHNQTRGAARGGHHTPNQTLRGGHKGGRRGGARPRDSTPAVGHRWPIYGNARPTSAPSRPTDSTRIELIVDRSGSMQNLLGATVSGLNEFVDMQRSQLRDAVRATVRLHVFDDQVETRWNEGQRLVSAPCVTEHDVMPRGSTALLDAIGQTLGVLPVHEPRIVCIVTDGEENSSRHWTREGVLELIARLKRHGWTFIFMAANQDAIQTGAGLGFGAGTCATFGASATGVRAAFGSAAASSCRASFGGSQAAAFTQSERAACNPADRGSEASPASGGLCRGARAADSTLALGGAPGEGGLFGRGPATTSSLFRAPPTGGVFGGGTHAAGGGTGCGMFGAPRAGGGGCLFGARVPAAGGGLFGAVPTMGRGRY